MKIVNKQLMFISSEERESGTASDFKITVPSHLLTCAPHQHLRVILNDVVLPYTWYNVQETNRHMEVVENGGTPFHVSLTIGSYNAIQLGSHLAQQLTYASANSGHGQSYTYSVAFDDISAKYTFTISTPTGVNHLTFASASHKLLGFAKGSVNSFSGSGSLTSTGAISMILTDALLFHCDLLNNNVDKSSGERNVYHVSDVFAKIMVNTSPFNNIIFENVNDDYLINIPERRITELRFWFTTTEHETIYLNDDFSFTLKLEVLEDDEKVLISQNTGIGELLKLLILQQHTQVRKSAD